jgi:hypothetical protein
MPLLVLASILYLRGDDMTTKTTQLATRIDTKFKAILDRLNEKTQIPIRQLTEKAILLLDEYYKELQKTYDKKAVDADFIHLLDQSIQNHDETYKKLAQ